MTVAIAKHKVFRFVVVGVVNTAFSYAVYAAMLFVGLGYAYANLVALVTGIVFSFRTHGRFVFDNRDRRLFGRYIVGWSVLYTANILLIKVIMQSGLDAYVAGALALPPIVIASYLIQKLFVFRVTKPQVADLE